MHFLLIFLFLNLASYLCDLNLDSKVDIIVFTVAKENIFLDEVTFSPYSPLVLSDL